MVYSTNEEEDYSNLMVAEDSEEYRYEQEMQEMAYSNLTIKINK